MALVPYVCPRCGAARAHAGGPCPACDAPGPRAAPGPPTEAGAARVEAWIRGYRAPDEGDGDASAPARAALEHALTEAGSRPPTPAELRRLLDGVVPHLGRGAVLHAIVETLLATPDRFAALDALRRDVSRAWTPRPPEGAAAADPVEGGTPWVRTQLATWAAMRAAVAAAPALPLLSIALAPLHHGGAVTAEELVAFVRAAEPELAPGPLAAAIAQLTEAHAGCPAIVAALTVLEAELLPSPPTE